MKEIEELQEEVTINEMIDVLLLDQLNAIYHQHGSQSNYYAERRDSTRFALLSRFRELEKKVEIERKDKDEAVKSVRIQYDSVCDMFHKREREYEDRITDLNNALINQLETGKQKTIYINQLEKENENLKTAYQDMGVERDVAIVAYENLKKYKLFFESCSCLFAEGVEFMTKTEIYESIKKEVKKLEGDQ